MDVPKFREDRGETFACGGIQARKFSDAETLKSNTLRIRISSAKKKNNEKKKSKRRRKKEEKEEEEEEKEEKE